MFNYSAQRKSIWFGLLLAGPRQLQLEADKVVVTVVGSSLMVARKIDALYTVVYACGTIYITFHALGQNMTSVTSNDFILHTLHKEVGFGEKIQVLWKN